MLNKDEIATWFQSLQTEICEELESLDGKCKFRKDKWERKDGGGGLSCIIEKGDIIEKGGVNFSAVSGPTPEKILAVLKLDEANFFATGVSIVLHPQNPWMPIIHMNIRYFEMTDGTYWFGGGIDLTPHYVTPEDGAHIHTHLKGVCDQFDMSYYPRFKKWADDYFYIKHRKETRGVGGIFFDRLSESSEKKSKNELWEFVQEVGKSFVPIYKFYASKYSDREYSTSNTQWQRLRRGRYVEFNLVWDKGTKFGLDTDGRTESILMSLPPDTSWVYDHKPEAGSAEADSLQWLKKDIDWIKYAAKSD
ncbi:MAG: oxygen-dependent coproporphyrinogen oxidase [Cyclobacteriaceae bacterium]